MRSRIAAEAARADVDISDVARAYIAAGIAADTERKAIISVDGDDAA